MNHNCYRAKFGIIKKGLGDVIWSKLRESSVGLFIKFDEVKYKWAVQRVHYFLTHQLAMQNIHEIWSLFGGRPIRFSLNEFEDITGLNCDPFFQNDEWDVDHKEFWNELKVRISDGPTYKELNDLMVTCALWSDEKKLMLGRLVILSVGVHGINHISRILLSSAKRVIDSVAFENYMWGRVAFDSSFVRLKLLSTKMIPTQYMDVFTYCWYGFIRVFLVLAKHMVRDEIPQKFPYSLGNHLVFV